MKVKKNILKKPNEYCGKWINNGCKSIISTNKGEKEEENGFLKTKIIFPNVSFCHVQPIVVPAPQRNEGVLRQTLLTPEKDTRMERLVEAADMEMDLDKSKAGGGLVTLRLFPAAFHAVSTLSPERVLPPDMENHSVSAQLSSEGEYTAHLLSQLSSTLPAMTCSQVSSVLSALEPSSQLLSSSSLLDLKTMETSSRKEEEKQQNGVHFYPRLEKIESLNGVWYRCNVCSYVSLQEGSVLAHLGKCPGEGNKFSCLACDNIFKTQGILKAHLIMDHNVSVNELEEIIAINLDKENTENKLDKAVPMAVVPQGQDPVLPVPVAVVSSIIPPPPGFSIFESVDKYMDPRVAPEPPPGVVVPPPPLPASSASLPPLPVPIKEEKKATGSKKGNKSKISIVNIEKEMGNRCNIDGCSVRFVSASILNYHKQCHDGAKWKCPECGDCIQSWSAASMHLWNQHGLDMELYSCDQCSYKTNSYSKLVNFHKRCHGEERPFLCDSCGKGFKTKKQLRNHKAVVHRAKEKGEAKLMSCGLCGRRFRESRLLKDHTDMVHRKLRPFLCSVCGHSASCRSALRIHYRQHTGEKPYRCTECEYATADHNSLRRHRMQHTGHKVYTCPICGYSSIQSSTYKTHLRNKHPGAESEGLIFSCHSCPFKTVKKDNYLAHAAAHSLSVRPPCEESKPVENTMDVATVENYTLQCEESKPVENAMDVSTVENYTLQNLVKEVSIRMLPCRNSYLGEEDEVMERLKSGKEMVDRDGDPLLLAPQPEDLITGDPP